jgi:transposase InsO family protein
VNHERQNPFQTISIDLITDLPVSNGFNSILTIVDHGCSKAAVFLPCTKAIDAPGVAELYVQRVFPFFGIPRRVISDRDLRFTSKFTTELCKILKIDQNLSTAYHPQMDGQSERANQQVEQYLRIYSNDEKNDWAELLPMAQYTHNAWKNESIQATPFEVLIGNTPTIQVEEKDLAVPEIARRKDWLERGRLRVQAALRNAL